MTSNRYRELETDVAGTLTLEELKEGWHFCPDWDYMLIGPGGEELKTCLCKRNKIDEEKD